MSRNSFSGISLLSTGSKLGDWCQVIRHSAYGIFERPLIHLKMAMYWLFFIFKHCCVHERDPKQGSEIAKEKAEKPHSLWSGSYGKQVPVTWRSTLEEWLFSISTISKCHLCCEYNFSGFLLPNLASFLLSCLSYLMFKLWRCLMPWN